MASLTVSSWYSITYVCIGFLSTGGSSSTERSLIPESDICKVLGIGVAVSVSTFTFSQSCLSFSLCFTPNRCSSSTITSPSFLGTTSFDKSLCVPITISTSPLLRSSIVFVCSFLVLNLDKSAIFTGKSFILCTKVL